MLRGIQRTDVSRGMCICKPGTLKLNRSFSASIYILNKEEGGREKPFVSGYRPQVI